MFLANLFSLLSESGDATGGSWKDKIFPMVIFGLLAVGLIVFMVFQSRARKKQQKEMTDMLDAVKPGNKVKTIGGICGIVVEVCPEDNTFVLETGTETSGKCYLKFDKQAIYQTDAVAKPADKKEEKSVEEKETEEVSEETPVEEVVAEEAPVEETEKKDE